MKILVKSRPARTTLSFVFSDSEIEYLRQFFIRHGYEIRQTRLYLGIEIKTYVSFYRAIHPPDHSALIDLIPKNETIEYVDDINSPAHNGRVNLAIFRIASFMSTQEEHMQKTLATIDLYPTKIPDAAIAWKKAYDRIFNTTSRIEVLA
ncbi:MAG: hypothetical protein QXV17_15210 [Candidatus Micrarchaeaceae archaeon]